MTDFGEQSRKDRARARVAARFDQERPRRRTKASSEHPEESGEARRERPSRERELRSERETRREREARNDREIRSERERRTNREPQGERSPQSEEQLEKDSAQQRLSFGSVFIGLLESYGIKFIAVLALVALLVLSFFVGSILRSCANEAQQGTSSSSIISVQPSAGTQTSTANSSGTTSSSSASSNSGSAASSQGQAGSSSVLSKISAAAAEKRASIEEDDVKISDVLEESLVKQIEAQAKVNKDTAWIATHPSEYAFDGWAVQYKILKLAAEEPAATTYVREWPELYPAEDQNLKSPHAIQGTTTGPKNIPQLYQWDPRWGYTVYSSTAFGMTGCCPTTLAMVYQGLTGKTDMTPYDMGVLAANDGYMSEYEGTDAFFLINEAQGLGLNCYEIYLATESMIAALENGDVLIANVGPGDFTNDGHFIVVTGLKDGKLIVNDPYSMQRSEKLWDPDEVMNQCKAVFAYSKA